MWLKEKREKSGMTQRKIAAEIGVTRQFIGMLENDRANPSPRRAQEIANILGFEWTRFFEKQDVEQKKG